ncbi:MAG: rhomboid family intramembrane serine protease [Paludibacteraceae bacterium]|nr:rhomboid family intramembrane serine protease [Paludibacteraceae bacterium]MBN2788212.1 rhomboid family intramembrane serine protease [Paludibacteraceae bacterium]
MFQNRTSFIGNLPPVTKNLLLINILLWFATFTLQQKIDLYGYLGMFNWQSELFKPVQIITYLFMHGDFWHLFFNMFGLFMFGKVIEGVLGSKRFIIFYMVCGIAAAFVQQLSWTIEPPQIAVTVGASGAVFGLLGAFVFFFPNEPLYFMFLPVPIKAKIMIPILVVVELFFGVANFRFDNIAHYAHLGGLLAGLLILLYWRNHPLDRFNRV